MTDHMTGVNVTTSGPVATPVRSNDGSERATSFRAQTCQRRDQRPASRTGGRAADTTKSASPGPPSFGARATQDRWGGLRGAGRVQRFRTPHEEVQGPGGCAQGALGATDRWGGVSQFEDLSFAGALNTQGGVSERAPSDRDRWGAQLTRSQIQRLGVAEK